MNLANVYIKIILSLMVLLNTTLAFAQSDTTTNLNNSEFPNSWDTGRDLRGRNGKVLAWIHRKSKYGFEAKSCILIFSGPDSLGHTEYFITEMYTDKKPFIKWYCAEIHYMPKYSDTASGWRFGFSDLHRREFTHKPTSEDLYNLLDEWQFALPEGFKIKIIEAGVDDKLWFDTFGFVPDKSKIIKARVYPIK